MDDRSRVIVVEERIRAAYAGGVSVFWADQFPSEGTFAQVTAALAKLKSHGKLDAHTTSYSADQHPCWEGDPKKFAALGTDWTCPVCDARGDEPDRYSVVCFMVTRFWATELGDQKKSPAPTSTMLPTPRRRTTTSARFWSRLKRRVNSLSNAVAR